MILNQNFLETIFCKNNNSLDTQLLIYKFIFLEWYYTLLMTPQQYIIKKRIMDLMFFALNIVNNVRDLVEKNNDQFSNTQVDQFKVLFKNMFDILNALPPSTNDIDPLILQEMKSFGNNIDKTILSMIGNYINNNNNNVTYPHLFTPLSNSIFGRSSPILSPSRDYNVYSTDVESPSISPSLSPYLSPSPSPNTTTTTTTTTTTKTRTDLFINPSFHEPRSFLEPPVISSPLSPNIISDRLSPPPSSIFKFPSQHNVLDLSKFSDKPVSPIPIPPKESPKKSVGRPKNDPTQVLTCTKCGTTKSPEFRFKTSGNPLCNACGIQAYKQINKEKELKDQFSISALVNQDTLSPPPPPPGKSSKKKPSHPYNRPNTRGKSNKK